MDNQDSLFLQRPATAARPLLGVTTMVVEDSRFASEAIRMLCQRSGARIRRADSILHAERHLKVYRPGVIIIDVGLPDGSGLDLIARLAATSPRVDVILGTSGDDTQQDAVLAAGADGFLPKPIVSLAAFQEAILDHLPRDRQPPGPRLVADVRVTPDKIALQDDLFQIAAILKGAQAEDQFDYVTQFLSGVARSAADKDLGQAVDDIAQGRATGAATLAQIASLTALVEARLAEPCIK